MKNIPFYLPNLPKGTLSEIKKVLDSGWITAGKNVKIFEKKFGSVIGNNMNVAVSSCTAALHLAYLAHGFGPGDEVIVPSFTFCATINTLEHVGARPVFCDIDENTMCIRIQDIEKKITPKTKGIVVVHYAGMPADMDAINKIANRNKLVVVEDAAHAFMTKYKGKYIGRGKNTTCFSFYATKNLTTVEGGMLSAVDRKVEEKIRILSMHGITKNAWQRSGQNSTWGYDVVMPGYKYNMTDVEAVIGLKQLDYVKQSVQKRCRLAKLYIDCLKGNTNLILPKEPSYKNSRHAWHLFVIRLKETSKINRDQLYGMLKDNGVQTNVHYTPNHMQMYYKNKYGKISLPISEKVFSSILTLPFYESLSEENIRYICKLINKIV